MSTVSGIDVVRSPQRLAPNPARLLARFFLPGQELDSYDQSHTAGVLSRVLALPEEDVAAALAEMFDRFDDRHVDLRAVLASNFALVSHRVPNRLPLSPQKKLLIGACFTQEASVEGAALFNPSVVPHPDQSNIPAGSVRFVLSACAVSVGRTSFIEFRTGVVGPDRSLVLDAPSDHLALGAHLSTSHNREFLRQQLIEEDADDVSMDFVLSQLDPEFDDNRLEHALSLLAAESHTHHGAARTTALIRRLAAGDYEIIFGASTSLSQRVLWPHSAAESHGMDDARFVQFTDDNGSVRYVGTYTAFDGANVIPQFIETTDFLAFRITRPVGAAAKNKGMAVFPRKVNGSYLALSRWDQGKNALTASDDCRQWGRPTSLVYPTHAWGLVQLGNAGSPMETEAGWLVITHEVGPMREYSLGAMLLDLDDPSKVIGILRNPLLRSEADEREGNVPNVVYSCGGIIVGDQIFLPYGVSDSSTRFAFVDLRQLLARLQADGTE
jgi:predicted GH43/DUF377 family glycosyl hydrolase